MAIKKRPSSEIAKESEWFKNPLSKLIGAITAISGIFAMGFSIGQYSKRLDFQMEKIELRQDCDEKVQAEINKFREAKLAEYGKAVDDIKGVLSEIQKKKNEN